MIYDNPDKDSLLELLFKMDTTVQALLDRDEARDDLAKERAKHADARKHLEAARARWARQTPDPPLLAKTAQKIFAEPTNQKHRPPPPLAPGSHLHHPFLGAFDPRDPMPSIHALAPASWEAI